LFRGGSGNDLPFNRLEFVPGRSQLARKGVGTIALAGDGQLLFRCAGFAGFRQVRYLGMRGS
jgi:hypothetical protein